MAGDGASSNVSRLRKRVEADTTSPSSLKRSRDGSAFSKCEECSKDVPVALINFHNCSLDAKIKMNLEAQVVEMPTEAEKKPAAEKNRVRKTEPNSRKGKMAKDPNKPKRPSAAFFVFMEDFRKSIKESNPDCKGGARVAKEGGEAWKSMSDKEKKVYIDKAAELKAEYEKAMEVYNEVDDDQEVDDSSEKEVKEEANMDDESEKDVKDKVDMEDESEKEVKEEAEVEEANMDDESEKDVKDKADMEDESEKEVKEEANMDDKSEKDVKDKADLKDESEKEAKKRSLKMMMFSAFLLVLI